MTARQLSEATGISERQIGRYFARGCPRTSAKSLLNWKRENIRDRNTGSNEPAAAGGIQAARLELIKQQTEREFEATEKGSLQNAKLRGELVPKWEIEHDITLAISRMRNRLEHLPTEISTSAPSELKAVAKSLAESTVRIALQELADAFEQLAEGRDDDE